MGNDDAGVKQKSHGYLVNIGRQLGFQFGVIDNESMLMSSCPLYERRSCLLLGVDGEVPCHPPFLLFDRHNYAHYSIITGAKVRKFF